MRSIERKLVAPPSTKPNDDDARAVPRVKAQLRRPPKVRAGGSSEQDSEKNKNHPLSLKPAERASPARTQEPKRHVSGDKARRGNTTKTAAAGARHGRRAASRDSDSDSGEEDSSESESDAKKKTKAKKKKKKREESSDSSSSESESDDANKKRRKKRQDLKKGKKRRS